MICGATEALSWRHRSDDKQCSAATISSISNHPIQKWDTLCKDDRTRRHCSLASATQANRCVAAIFGGFHRAERKFDADH
jgi:hypothetical protein